MEKKKKKKKIQAGLKKQHQKKPTPPRGFAIQCVSEAVSHSRAAGSRRQLLGFDVNLFLPRRRRLSPLGIFPERGARISGVSEGLSFCSPSQPPAAARSRTQVAERRRWLGGWGGRKKIYAVDSAGRADGALSWWAPLPSWLLSGRRHFFFLQTRLSVFLSVVPAALPAVNVRSLDLSSPAVFR